MQSLAVALRSQGKLIALVPTRGSLHAGHRRLVEVAKKEADRVILSIFVNPHEFGPNEDLAQFPRDREGDLDFCREAGVDSVFMPCEKEMYPPGYSTWVEETRRAAGMCGLSRPHYFRGACTVYVKLFNIVRPDSVLMGWRDAQLAAVVRKMVEDLNFPVDITMVETVRAEDGVALNARNAYFDDFQRRDAPVIHNALLKGKELVDSGITNVDRVLAEITHHMSQNRRIRLIYVSAVDRMTMEPVRQIEPGRTLLAAAAWCDQVRLIDNVLV